jgi:hypothetical protein
MCVFYIWKSIIENMLISEKWIFFYASLVLPLS